MLSSKPNRILLYSGEGTFGKEHYARFIQSFARDLAVHEHVKVRPEEETTQAARIEIVESEEELWEKVNRHLADTIVFFSTADYPLACQLRKQFPQLNVFLLAGREIDNQPFIIPKALVGQALIAAIARW